MLKKKGIVVTYVHWFKKKIRGRFQSYHPKVNQSYFFPVDILHVFLLPFNSHLFIGSIILLTYTGVLWFMGSQRDMTELN